MGDDLRDTGPNRTKSEVRAVIELVQTIVAQNADTMVQVQRESLKQTEGLREETAKLAEKTSELGGTLTAVQTTLQHAEKERATLDRRVSKNEEAIAKGVGPVAEAEAFKIRSAASADWVKVVIGAVAGSGLLAAILALLRVFGGGGDAP